MTGDLKWTVRARCVQDHVPTSYFFANDEHPVTPAREALIADYCSECPVRRDCFELGRSFSHPSGFWGGINLDKRRNRKKAS